MTTNDDDNLPDNVDDTIELILNVDSDDMIIESIRANVSTEHVTDERDRAMIDILITLRMSVDTEPIPPLIMPDEPTD